MTEAATYDPMAASLEQADSPPQTDGPDNPKAPEREETMGSGMFETDTADTASEQQPGHTDDADPAEGESPADLPDSEAAPDQERGYLRQEDYTRKTQELAREREAVRQEREQWLREREQAAQQAQQASQAQQPGQPESLAARMESFAQQLANDPNVSAADRQGVAFMAQAMQTVEEQKAAIEELRTKLGQYEPQIEQATKVATEITQREQATIRDRLTTEVNQAKELFGEETLTKVNALLKPVLLQALQGQPALNPETQKPWTVPELVAGFSGRSLEDAKAAKAGNRQGTVAAKRGAAVPRGTAAAPAPTGGHLTREQAIAEIESTM